MVVDARASWQSTGMVVHGPGQLEFRAVGKWIFNPHLPAADGDGDCRFSTSGRAMYAFSGPRGCEGQLIGRIGGGTPFVAGARGSYTVEKGMVGSLYLVINDDLEGVAGQGLRDNSGKLTVTIQQK